MVPAVCLNCYALFLKRRKKLEMMQDKGQNTASLPMFEIMSHGKHASKSHKHTQKKLSLQQAVSSTFPPTSLLASNGHKISWFNCFLLYCCT